MLGSHDLRGRVGAREAEDAMAGGDELAGDRGADPTRCTGDEDTHDVPPVCSQRASYAALQLGRTWWNRSPATTRSPKPPITAPGRLTSCPSSARHAAASSWPIRQPVPGLTETRFTNDGHLMRTVPDRYLDRAQPRRAVAVVDRSCAVWSSTPGTLSIKVPGQVYAESARDGRAEFQVVLFDAALVDDARAALDRPVVAPELHAIDGGDPRARPLLELHHQLLDRDERPALEQALCAALTSFVELSCAPRGTRAARSSTAAVARARAMLDDRLAETVGLDELAAHARTDKFHLCRAFREQVGLPPHAYVTHRRISLAQDLLARGIAQAEVAARVGLYDQSLLHRHFKRILGVTPGEFARASVGR